MKSWFMNLKLFYKLFLSMIAITTISLFFIIGISYTYFYHRNMREVEQKARDSVQMSSSTLSSQFFALSSATNMLLVKSPFPSMILDINTGNFQGYAQYFSQATAETDSFLQNQSLVANVLLLGEDNIFFSSTALGIAESTSALLPEVLWDYPSIAIFPTRPNTLFRQGEVIPVSFPVSCQTNSGNLDYADQEGSKKVRLVLLLDTEQIRNYFDRMSNSYTNCMYLASEDGLPLDINSSHYSAPFLEFIQNFVKQNRSADNIELSSSNGEVYLLSMDSIPFCGLKVVHLVEKSALLGNIQELRSFFLFAWVSCAVLSGFLSLLFSRILTRRMNRLGEIIDAINQDSYTAQTVFPYSDEIDRLGRQLNRMYGTIQKQLAQIKEEEQKKAEAEIQMLSEQINPHFLYNTLECIHFQVLNRHTKNAAAMLESLGKYLRITLSLGDAFIPIEKELEHATSYLDIINRHSPDGITCQCQVSPDLLSLKVPKVILQPLIENSIRHGFEQNGNFSQPIPPKITITISSQEEKFLQIQVSDNGQGIDLAKASACLTASCSDGKKHFGLNNIYKRLTACFGDQASVAFESIPYLKNSVIIRIPRVN